MFCSKCGSKIQAGKTSCDFCGQRTTGFHDHPIGPDFITLNCPSCGGKLTYKPNAETVVCQYCNSEHLIRRNERGISLETFARCPTCGRNDKSVKATIKYGYPPEPSLHMQNHIGLSCLSYFFIFHALGSIPLLYYFISTKDDYVEGKAYGVVIIIIIIIICLAIAFLPMVISNRKIDKINLAIVEKAKVDKIGYLNNLMVWEKLYYCERDGSFFPIDENKIITIEDIHKLFPLWDGWSDKLNY